MNLKSAAFGSAAWLVLAPGLVSGLVPWLLTGWDRGAATALPVQVLGVVVATAGSVVVVVAFVQFVSEGCGTPAPVAPAQRLVVGGLYRFVRNPMYVAVVSVVVGQALLLGRPVLYAYAAAAWLVMATFVRFHEEPTLHRQFGGDYDRYRTAVPAWIPRTSPWPGVSTS